MNGKHAGKRLYDVIGAFPLSIALVDAEQDLSIQVHPDGDLAKYESYYFIEAPKSGRIYCGIDNLPPESIRAAIETNAILPRIGQIPIQPEDYVFIEPRTVHALSAGSFVYEIEHGEDNTYRLFDYNRVDADGNQRPTQVEQAMRWLDATLCATPRQYHQNQNTVIAEKTYVTKLLTDVTTVKNTESVYECLTLLSGNAAIDGVPLKIGMTVIIEPDEKLERLRIDKCILVRPL